MILLPKNTKKHNMGSQTTYEKKTILKKIILFWEILESKILNKMGTYAIFVGTAKWRIWQTLNYSNGDNLSDSVI